VPRKQKKYHFIYKTTCLITNKYYIGMHSTNDLNDGYLGSGTILKRSIRKHGKENHKLETLEFLSNRTGLSAREKEIVSEDIVKNSLCMNIKLGGDCGWEGTVVVKDKENNTFRVSIDDPRYINKELLHVNCGKIRSDMMKYKYSESKTGEKNHMFGKHHTEEWKTNHSKTMIGRTLSEEHKQKLRGPKSEEHRKKIAIGASGRGRFCWVCMPDNIFLKIHSEDLDSYLLNGWQRGMKIKPVIV
jgi:group I intron endonuclease